MIQIAGTGSGKSRIADEYTLGARVRTIWVVPLIALARQHAARLRQLGLKTVLSCGGADPWDLRADVWITSPERLQESGAKRFLKEWRPQFWVIDECHCLWEWGEDFRPAFLSVPDWVRESGADRSLWLTATLPHEALAELKLGVPKPQTVLGQFKFPDGLILDVERASWANRFQALLTDLESKMGSGILFVLTREGAERLARALMASPLAHRFDFVAYHAGMLKEERMTREGWLRGSGRPRCLIATSAFGLGMDYPNLEWCVIYQAPPSLLALAQMLGRVGRAGRKGSATLLWDIDDFRLLEWMVTGSERKRRQLREVVNVLTSGDTIPHQLSGYLV